MRTKQALRKKGVMWKTRIVSWITAVAVGFSTAVVMSTPSYAVTNLTVGSTWAPGEMATRQPTEPFVEVSRVFFSGTSCPNWVDSRVTYLWAHGIIPFVSFKLTGTAAQACIHTMLNTLPSTKTAWIANYHEAEVDMAPAPYIALQQADWNIIRTSQPYAAGRVKFMSIQTRQWTENTAGRSYATYWCSCGDYFAVDMYVNSWEGVYPNAAAFIHDSLDFAQNVIHMPVFYPELGSIQMPTDTTDTGRAAWITAVAAYMKTHINVGALWWDDEGTGGRDFRLHGPSLAAWNAVLAAN